MTNPKTQYDINTINEEIAKTQKKIKRNKIITPLVLVGGVALGIASAVVFPNMFGFMALLIFAGGSVISGRALSEIQYQNNQKLEKLKFQKTSTQKQLNKQNLTEKKFEYQKEIPNTKVCYEISNTKTTEQELTSNL